MSKGVRGSIDLLKMEKACILTIKGVKCVVVPIGPNDIYCGMDKETGATKSAYLGLTITERKEKSQYGKTHYCKQNLSKEFLENVDKEIVDRKKSQYLGDFTAYSFDDYAGKVENIQAPVVSDIPQEELDNVPF